MGKLASQAFVGGEGGGGGTVVHHRGIGEGYAAKFYFNLKQIE